MWMKRLQLPHEADRCRFLPILAAAAPILGAGIGAIGSAVGQASANDTNMKIAEKNNEFNAHQAELNRGFQERMSNSAYQRATADMRAAGINPMLAISQGGANSPSGGAASSAGNARVENVLGDLPQAAMSILPSALALAKGASEIKATEAQATKTTEEAKSVPVFRESSALDVERKRSEMDAVKAEALLRKRQADVDAKMVIPDAIGSRAGKILEKAMDVFMGISSAGAKKRMGDLLEDKLLNQSGDKGIRVRRRLP